VRGAAGKKRKEREEKGKGKKSVSVVLDTDNELDERVVAEFQGMSNALLHQLLRREVAEGMKIQSELGDKEMERGR
jgi:hypothetical protein